LRPSGTLHLTIFVMPGAFVRTVTKVLLHVPGEETAGEVKQRLVDGGAMWGPPEEQVQDAAHAARLLHRGMTLVPDVSLKAQGVNDGSVLRLLPAMGRSRIRCGCDGRTWHSTHAEPALRVGAGAGSGSSAPRGLLMNPGTRPWSVVNAQQGPEELVPDHHTVRALHEAHAHHRSLFAQSPKMATA